MNVFLIEVLRATKFSELITMYKVLYLIRLKSIRNPSDLSARRQMNIGLRRNVTGVLSFKNPHSILRSMFTGCPRLTYYFQISLATFYIRARNFITLFNMLREILSLGNSLRFANNFAPNGGFFTINISIR